MPVGEGVWRVWRVLEVLEGFGRFAGWQTTALTANRNHCCGPDSEVALALGCLLGKVFGGFGGFWTVWRVLEVLQGLECLGWQTAALKANRKPLLWPWPWGA